MWHSWVADERVLYEFVLVISSNNVTQNSTMDFH